MGANAYLSDVATYGYNNSNVSAATHVIAWQPVPGKPGKRLAILSYAATTGTLASAIIFQGALGYTTVAVAAVSDATHIDVAAEPGPAAETFADQTAFPTNIMASGDYICIVMDNGTYMFNRVTTWTLGSLAMSISTAITQPLSVGARIYNLGLRSDFRHPRRMLTTTGTSNTDKNDPFLVACNIKGSPMIVSVGAVGSAGQCAIDLLQVGYFTV